MKITNSRDGPNINADFNSHHLSMIGGNDGYGENAA
jgi:ribosomal protein S6E (S10)